MIEQGWTVNVQKNLMFKTPFTMIVAGSTGSGKSQFVHRLVVGLVDMMTPEIAHLPLRVVWVYGIWQEKYKIPFSSHNCSIIYTPDIPEDTSETDVIVLDDLMSNLGDQKMLSDLFTKKSHHNGISVIFVIQNLFHQGKQMRNVALNSHYLVLTKNRRDLTQIATLGRQLFARSRWFEDAYKKAVLNREFSHLLIDLTPTTEERNRIRSSVTPQEFPIEIFAEDESQLNKMYADTKIATGAKVIKR